jgi:hypothetical protein
MRASNITKTTRTPLLALLGLLVGPLSLDARQEFSSGTCHVTFQHPSDWTVTRDTTRPDTPCLFVVRATAWDSLIVEADSTEYASTVWVEVIAAQFVQALSQSPFEPRELGWVVGGRLGLENPAWEVARPGWRVLRGDAPLGCYRIGGGYVGACEFPVALAGAGGYTAMLQGGLGSDDAFDQILATLEFRP